MTRAYYSESINNFLDENNDNILGQLTRNHNHSLEDLQRNAWISQINILKSKLVNITCGHIYFEFSIPRMGKRVDNILIINDSIFIIEFKVGSEKYDNYAIEQVLDYSVDLKNFHEGSHHQKIFPILICTEANHVNNKIEILQELLFKPLLTNTNNFIQNINNCLQYSKYKSK